MKNKILAIFFIFCSQIVSHVALAQMSEIENLKKLSSEAAQKADLFAQLLASQTATGQFIFIKDEGIKQILVSSGIRFIKECYNYREILSYCIDKREGSRLLDLYRSQMIDSRAYYESYLRALRAVDSQESRLELRNEIEKQRQAQAELKKQLDINASQYREDYSQKHPIRSLIHKLKSAFGVGLFFGAPYAFLSVILGPEVIMVSLISLVMVSSGGLVTALDFEEDLNKYVQKESAHLKAEIDKKNRLIADQVKLTQIIDQAVLEKMAPEKSDRQELMP